MRVKVGVVAATAALFLTASGLAQAQQSSSPSGSSGITTQSRPSGSMSSTSSSTRLDRSTLHEVKDDNMTAAGLNVNAKDLQSMAIYGSDGKKIGEVKNVLADSSNQIKAVSADVGGFLGMGAREVVFPIDKLQKGSDKDRLQTAMTKDEIQNLEAWNDNGRGSTSGSSTAPSRSNSGSAPSTGSSSGSSSGSSTGSSVR